MLLGDRDFVTARTPMPVADMGCSTAAESYSYTLTLADGAAGTTQNFQLPHGRIYDSKGNGIAKVGNTSFAFTTGTALTTEVPWVFSGHPQKDTDAERLATLGNGEFMVDYENGQIIGKNAITTSSDTDVVTYTIKSISTLGGALASYGTPTVAINAVVLDDDPTSYTSAEIDLGTNRGLNLLLSVLSTSTPTSVQFFLLGSDTSGGTFNTIVAPRVNLLIYGNAETASVNVKNIPVEVVGKRYVKVQAVGVGTTGAAYFTISATVTPFN